MIMIKLILAFILGLTIGGLGMFLYLSLMGKVQNVSKRKV